MSVMVSKWGNSLGIRIPLAIVEALSIKSGDTISYEVKNNSVILKKEKSSRQLFEEFYGKSFESISLQELGTASIVDFGDDIGGEVF